MNRLSWIFIISTIVICGLLSFFFIRKSAFESWSIYKQTGTTEQKLEDLSKKKDLLSELSKNNQLANLYDIASKYIPENPNSDELIVELSAMAEQAKMKVTKVSLDNPQKPSKTSDDEAGAGKKSSSNQPTSQNTGSGQEVNFSIGLSGNFSDFLNFLKSTETNSRLISIEKMSLSQGQEDFTANLNGKAFWSKSSTQSNNSNLEISKETIEKFKNLRTFGNPINLPTESGFGRSNPFANY